MSHCLPCICRRRSRAPGSLWRLLGLALLMLPALPGLDAGRAHAAASPEDLLGPCQVKDVEDAFPEPARSRAQLHVLVTRFAGVHDELKQAGAQVGTSLRDALVPYVRKALNLQNSGLSTADLHVHYVGCVINGHEHARHIGRAAGASVVFWGHVYGDKRLHPANLSVELHLEGANSHTTVQSSPYASVVNQVTVQLPTQAEPEDAFKTSLTVVRWEGLDGDSERSVRIPSPSKLASMHLPGLTSRHLRLLFDCVIGLYALQAGRHGLGVRFLDPLQGASAGVEGAHDLHRIMGKSLIIAGQPQRGLEELLQARSLCKPTDTTCLYRTEYRLGWAKARLGHRAEALLHYEAALGLLQHRNRFLEGAALNGLGRVHAEMGDKLKGQGLCEQALQTCRQAGARACEAEALSNLANIAAELGDLERARELGDQALQRQQEGEPDGAAATLNRLGRILLMLGKKERAPILFEQALSLAKQVGDQQAEATALAHLGSWAEAQGELAHAQDLYSQALPLAMKAGDRDLEATARVDLGRLVERTDQQKAKGLYEQARTLSKQTKAPEGEAAALSRLARLLASEGDGVAAVALYREAADVMLRLNPPNLDKAEESLHAGLRQAERYRLAPQVRLLRTALKSVSGRRSP